MAKVYGFDEAGFKRVQEATRRTLGSPRTGSQRRRQSPVLSESSLRFAKLNEDLDTGGLTTPETAEAEFYSTTDDDPPELEASGNTFTVTNYSSDFSAASGDFIIVSRIQGVWHIIAADC